VVEEIEAVPAAICTKPVLEFREGSGITALEPSVFLAVFYSFRYVTNHLIYQLINVFSASWETLDPLIKVTRMGQPLAADDMHRERMVRIPDIPP
jgi:hypothetical protein